MRLIALEGKYQGQPSSRERLAELLGRTPTVTERNVFKKLRSKLGSDPTIEEFSGYRRLVDEHSKR